MSLNLMAWAFAQKVDPPAKLVLLALADHANGQTGLCIPSQQLLAEQCTMSIRTIQRHLITLETAGLIRREARMRGQGRGRTSDAYYLNDQHDNTGPTRQSTTTNTTNHDDQHDTVVVAEPEVTGSELTTCKEVNKTVTRKPDLLFEALAETCGINTTQLTVSSRGQLNRATKELRDIGATPEQVTGKAAAYRKTYDDAVLTPTALAKHWPSLATKSDTSATKCRECFQPLADHDEEVHNLITRR